VGFWEVYLFGGGFGGTVPLQDGKKDGPTFSRRLCTADLSDSSPANGNDRTNEALRERSYFGRKEEKKGTITILLAER